MHRKQQKKSTETWQNRLKILSFRDNYSIRLVVYKFFSCSTNIPLGLSAYKPQKLVVYCLTKNGELGA